MAGADLDRAEAIGAIFAGADLSRARLSSTDLSGANLKGANLDGALLRRTNLSGADLSGAKGLSSKQLALACGDEATKLPEGLSVEVCDTAG